MTGNGLSATSVEDIKEIKEKVHELEESAFFQEMEFDKKVKGIDSTSAETVASIVDTAFLAMGRQVDEMADAS